MTAKLQNVVVNEISLVKRGANNKKIFLTKAATAPDTEKETMADTKTPEAVALEKAQADLKAAQEKTAELEKAQADFVAQKAVLEKAKADAESALAIEKEAKEVSECIQKAAVDFKDIPEKAEVVGPLLRAVKKADAKVGESLEALLKKLNEVAKAVTKSVGSTIAEEKPETALAEINKRAEALIKQNPKLTLAKAFEQVLNSDKNLYAQHVAEQNAR